MYGCPRCASAHDTIHACAQHLWKSRDASHEDVDTLEDAIIIVASSSADRELADDGPLAPSSDEESDEDTDTVTDTVNHGDSSSPSQVTREPDAPPVDAARTDGGSAPFGAPDTDIKTDGGRTKVKVEDPECPACGSSRWFDASEVGFDYGCADCSSPESWEVWNEEDA